MARVAAAAPLGREIIGFQFDAPRESGSNRAAMADAWKSKLLILQDRDMKLRQIRDDLERLPRERKEAQSRIEGIERRIEESREAIRKLEVEGHTVESELAQVEAQLVKYKNQQLQVKKNEEYQALTHEIEGSEAKIADLEERELEILYAVDEARREAEEKEREFRQQIEMEKRLLERLAEREGSLAGELEAAQEAYEAAEAEVERPYLSVYQRVGRGLKFPIIVALRSARCSGCHMKVSAAVEHETRKGQEITTCDSCHRILYWED